MPEAAPKIQWHRRLADKLATALAVICVLLVMLPLAAIFIYLVIRGVGSLNLAFFTHIPSGSPGEPGGGIANAIIGSVVILLMGSVIGVPLGVGSGIYLSEYSRGQFGKVVRFTADVLNGVPSIVIGIAVYALLVVRQRHFSALAGAKGGSGTGRCGSRRLVRIQGKEFLLQQRAAAPCARPHSFAAGLCHAALRRVRSNPSFG